jgi:hypothetical protein
MTRHIAVDSMYCIGGYFVKPARRIGFIVAAMLMATSLVTAPALGGADDENVPQGGYPPGA